MKSSQPILINTDYKQAAGWYYTYRLTVNVKLIRLFLIALAAKTKLKALQKTLSCGKNRIKG